MSHLALDMIEFDDNGLIPAVVQDAHSGEVLMLAYMNREALQKTRETGRTHFWSRSRGKLWRKGETSGHEQIVVGIRINCERNSLLIEAIQSGAVCHDGFATCFYRTLGKDGVLTTIRERAFDPESVYGPPPSENPGTPLAQDPTSVLFSAYQYLRDHDLSEQSGTSRRLRASGEPVNNRIADELDELAGVLTGAHRHSDLASDVRLEASQVIYWLLVEIIRLGLTWEDVRPDRALLAPGVALSSETVSRLLQAESSWWEDARDCDSALGARAHATLAIVAQACHVAGIDPVEPVRCDLVELRSRPYLAPFFSDVDQASSIASRPSDGAR